MDRRTDGGDTDRDDERDRRYALAEAALSEYLELAAPDEPRFEESRFEAWAAQRPEISGELRELHAVCTMLGASDDEAGAEPEAARLALELLRSAPNRSSEYAIEAAPLAEGGMGTIYAARDRTLGRDLAIKVLRDGPRAAGPRRIVRFLDEARITSRLDHPGIVPVHEIGLDAERRPYFTMKRVRGTTLERVLGLAAAGDARWTLARVLGVLERVCEAVAFAHRSGVVHRDLKPSNVMVGDFGEVYVMDWGLARVLDGRREEGPGAASGGEPADAARTRDGDVLGTPDYMAPEQAFGRLAEVGPTADVYSIGAMLYQLLAGRAPYADPGGAGAARDVLARLREGPPPSLRALAPGAEPELVAICERAMQRDPRRRYPDVAALSADLSAHLRGRVVRAHEEGTWAEIRKWIGRNRALSAAAALALASLAGGGAVATLYAAEARRQAELARDQSDRALASAAAAEGARAQAEAHAEDARRNEAEARSSERRAKRVTQLVQEALAGSDPHQGGTRSLLVAEAMDRAIVELDSGALADDPETEAALQATVARILQGNGRADEGLRLARRALATRRELHGEDHPDVASSLNDVACCLQRIGDDAEALPAMRAAHDALRRLHPGDHRDVATGINNVARCLDALARGDEALPLHREALAMRRRLFAGDHADVAQSLNNLGLCLANRGEPEAALVEFEAALAMNRRVHGGDHPDVALTLLNVATCLEQLGRSGEALPLHEEALAIDRRLFEGDHPATAAALGGLASCLASLDRRDESLPLQRAALEMRRRLYPGDHPELAVGLHNLAAALSAAGRHGEALPLYEEALRMNDALIEGDAPQLAACAIGVATSLEALGRTEEALETHRGVLALRRRLAGGADGWEVAGSHWYVGRCLDALGRGEEALREYESALAISERLRGPVHADVANCLVRVARSAASLGRTEEARMHAERAERIASRVLPVAHPLRVACEELAAELASRQ